MTVPPDYKTTFFLNLPVSDLSAALQFYTSLGFIQNKTFSDENAAMVSIPLDLHEEEPDTSAAHKSPLKIMLLNQSCYKKFLPGQREAADPKKVTQALFCLSIATRDKLDAFMDNAKRLGAEIDVREPQDYGWMYGRAFADLDGHIWEVTWMDPSGYQDKE
ncbi:hypothetical protein B0A52_09764 [Exophiala mesophila]|uniref:VOC domain-containing protein n=1 Tax=Exophiala mesophila TaxID=212818 RepID=A0A438MRS1_EXOME|nr:hypothetical protein B0A52_09764 [Exophiala mesophila]